MVIQMINKIIRYLLLLVCIPAAIIVGTFALDGRKYAFIILLVAILACLPFFLTFERKKTNTRRITIIALLSALSVAGRFVFAVLPGFKPVTAMTVIAGIYFGGETGFLCGALTALVSNFYFGQGPWTPFQMFAWGIIGLIAGILSKQLKGNKVLLSLYGILSGVIYSLLMDVWSVVWYSNTFNFELFLARLTVALPYTAIYALSNVIFLLLLIGPIGKKLNRIQLKYGV